MVELDDVTKVFIVEALEGLGKLEEDLLAYEKDPTDNARVSNLFRVMHSIKGACGFFGFTQLQSIAHAAEDLLGALRHEKIAISPRIVTVLLTSGDTIRAILGEIEATGKEGTSDHSALIEELTLSIEESQSETAQIPASTPVPVPTTGEIAPASQPPLKATAKTASALSDNTIRLNVALLDKLMNLVGELVLTRNQVLQINSKSEDPAHIATCQRLNLITTELQEGVMKTRMQPISSIWDKFPRMVRDLSKGCGKQIRIEMEGKETELDKSVIEAIVDPLTHMIRNSIDHAIELPQQRLATGKPEEGCISLSAFHEGGQLTIQVADDGAGINLDRVKRKAIEIGLITEAKASEMDNREALNLLFLPGFSTADKITNLSGRGVGMDVVKSNVERIGGTIDIDSTITKGTTIKLKIPLTLLIVPALIITHRGQRFAIPQANLLELVRLDLEQNRSQIEYVHGSPVYRLRGKLLPIVFLGSELHPGATASRSGTENFNIVVLQAGVRSFGLVVDEVNDTQEIVVKPLSETLRKIGLFAGATIMGDGNVALILDISGLAQKAKIVSDAQAHGKTDTRNHLDAKNEKTQSLLIFQTPDEGRMSVGLSSIARLETFQRSQVEIAGNSDVVQYRNQIMPLIYVSEVLPERRVLPRRAASASLDEDSIQVVVINRDDEKIGLVVDRVLDIVEIPVNQIGKASRPGVAGTLIVKNRVMELLDINGIISLAEKQQAEATEAAPDTVMEGSV